MFLRRNRRVIRGEIYEYWSLVRSVRTARGPRQEVVAVLGKTPGLEKQARRGWDALDDLLEGRQPIEQGRLGMPMASKAAEQADEAPQVREEEPRRQWAQVDLAGLRVERVREFGRVYLGLSLWRRLGLHTLLKGLIESGKEDVPWDLTACILTLARFCGNKSELEVAERWYADSALEDLLGVRFGQVNESRLYRGLDVLHAHKDLLCQHLLERYRSWFGVRFEFLLYDVTSTYFEGQAMGNEKAARGYSRDQRPDCKQVNIGLVVTPEGLPVGYEVFAGNTVDVSTVEDMVELMEKKYGQPSRIWVMDRGMVSEENIEFLRERGARYLVGTPKKQLKAFEAQLLEEANWTQVQPGVEAKLVEHPDGEGREQYVLCRSVARRQKEAAMLERQRVRLLAKLEQTARGLRKRPAKDPGAIERRIGRWLGRYPGAERLMDVEVRRDDKGRACDLSIVERAERSEWSQLAHGAYLLRTNCFAPPRGAHPPLRCGQHRGCGAGYLAPLGCTEKDPAQLWRWYIQLTQAEDAFRISKSDLNLRPVFHQKTQRVEAHILVCFLSLALWRTLEQWMHGKGLGTCARQLLLEVATVHSLDVVLPTRPAPGEPPVDLRLRVVARPEREVAELLHRLGVELPAIPKIVQNVVEKTGL